MYKAQHWAKWLPAWAIADTEFQAFFERGLINESLEPPEFVYPIINDWGHYVNNVNSHHALWGKVLYWKTHSSRWESHTNDTRATSLSGRPIGEESSLRNVRKEDSTPLLRQRRRQTGKYRNCFYLAIAILIIVHFVTKLLFSFKFKISFIKRYRSTAMASLSSPSQQNEKGRRRDVLGFNTKTTTSNFLRRKQ